MRFAYLLLFSALFGFTQPSASGQETPAAMKPLTIGDIVPDVVLENIINYSSPSARLSQFKGKLIILDFWATWCGSCIKSFPKLDSIQKSSKGDVSVLLVSAKNTGDTKQKVEAFFQRFKKKYPAFSLSCATEDSLLLAYFPFKLLPHYVWLNESKQVIAITTAAEITKENIAAAVKNQSVSTRTKQDLFTFNSRQPLFLNGNGGNGETVQFRSLIASYTPGISTGASRVVNKEKLITQLTYRNSSLLHLFKLAFQVQLPASRILLNVRHPDLLTNGAAEWSTWRINHAWCYELVTPPVSEETAFHKMRADLLSFFPYTVSFETRVMDAWILCATPGAEDIASASGCKPAYNFSSPGNKYIACQPLSFLINHLAAELPVAIIDETNIKGEVSLKLSDDLYNLEKLNRSLRGQGLYFKAEKRPVTVLVINDKY